MDLHWHSHINTLSPTVQLIFVLMYHHPVLAPSVPVGISRFNLCHTWTASQLYTPLRAVLSRMSPTENMGNALACHGMSITLDLFNKSPFTLYSLYSRRSGRGRRGGRSRKTGERWTTRTSRYQASFHLFCIII